MFIASFNKKRQLESKIHRVSQEFPNSPRISYITAYYMSVCTVHYMYYNFELKCQKVGKKFRIRMSENESSIHF
jgi:hypothetical protein